MALYVTPSRCTYCRKFDLPCNDDIHGNPLYPYLGAADNAVPVIPGMAEPVTILPTPPPARSAADRARTLSTVALIVLFLVAGIVAIGVVAFIGGTGNHPCSAPPCSPVQYATPHTARPTLPPPPR